MKKIFLIFLAFSFNQIGFAHKEWVHQHIVKPSYIFLALLLWLFSSQPAASQGTSTYINPGLKLGYTFGENGGFTAGIEISYTWANTNLAWGVLSSADWCNGLLKIHLGLEAARGVGISIGPSITKKIDTIDYGITVTPFAGFILYPFYSYTWRMTSPNIQEVGAFLKFPIQTSGERIKFGN